MATSSIWVNPTQITAGPGIEVDATGVNSARVSARISTDPASILQFNPDGSLAAYEGGASNVVRQVPNNYDLTQYLGEQIVYRGALFKFVPDDPLFPTVGEYKQASPLVLDTIPSTYIVDFVQVAGENYIWDAVLSSYQLVGAHFFPSGAIPIADVGPIQVIGEGWYRWVGTAGGITYNKYISAGISAEFRCLAGTPQALPTAPSTVKIRFIDTVIPSSGISLTPAGDIKVALPGRYKLSGSFHLTMGSPAAASVTTYAWAPNNATQGVLLGNLTDVVASATYLPAFTTIITVDPEDEAPYLYGAKSGAGDASVGVWTTLAVERIGDI